MWNNTFYYHVDGNKNVSELTNSDGNIIAHYEYSPFGKIFKQSGAYADINPLRFSSEYYDKETGLIYYNYRYYDPQTGHWLSRDPIGEKGGLNLYAFVNNQSANRSDYLGLTDSCSCEDDFWDWLNNLLSDTGNGISNGFDDVLSWLIGRNRGKAWGDVFNPNSWGDGPTGGYLPRGTTADMWNIRKSINHLNPQNNGMHAWHAASNAYLAQQYGLVGLPFVWTGGLLHETPLDWSSWCAELKYQGVINHFLDSMGDLFANVLGGLMGLGGFSPETAGEVGNKIPGPGEPDPTFGGHGRGYQGHPSDAW